MHFFINVSILLVGLYALLCLLLFVFQSRLVYYPSSQFRETPAIRNLAFENLMLKSSGGARVNAWFVPSPQDRATALLCHGNAGNISHRLDIIEVYHALGLNVLIFDYQGFGASEGKPSEQGTYDDSEAAWRYLTEVRSIPKERIVVLGRSLGGAIAARLAERHRPAALILDFSFVSLPEAGAAHYPFLPVRLLTRYKYPTGEFLRKVRCPVLITHSPDDKVVDFSHGQRLFALAPEPKQFLEMPGGHDDWFYTTDPAYSEAVEALLRESLKSGESPQVVSK